MKATDYRQAPDARLVEIYRQTGDTVCLGELYQRYYPRILQYCLRIVQDREQALDLTQDTFVRAADKIADLRNTTTFSAWLFRIAHNSCLDHCRRHQRDRFAPLDGYPELSEEPVNWEELFELENRHEAIAELMEELGDESRDMLRLKYLENQSIQYLQERYHLSASAVKMRLARARSRVARLYGRRPLVG